MLGSLRLDCECVSEIVEANLRPRGISITCFAAGRRWRCCRLAVDACWITGNLEVRGEKPTSQDRFVLGYYPYQEADSRVRRLPFFLDLAQS